MMTRNDDPLLWINAVDVFKLSNESQAYHMNPCFKSTCQIRQNKTGASWRTAGGAGVLKQHDDEHPELISVHALGI